MKLRYTHPTSTVRIASRADRRGMWIAAGLTTFWTALGSFVAVFPGVLESLFGIDYNFSDTWGVSRTTFEALTLGTLAVVFGHRVVGYWLGRDGARARGGASRWSPLEAAAPAAIT